MSASSSLKRKRLEVREWLQSLPLLYDYEVTSERGAFVVTAGSGSYRYEDDELEMPSPFFARTRGDALACLEDLGRQNAEETGALASAEVDDLTWSVEQEEELRFTINGKSKTFFKTELPPPGDAAREGSEELEGPAYPKIFGRVFDSLSRTFAAFSERDPEDGGSVSWRLTRFETDEASKTLSTLDFLTPFVEDYGDVDSYARWLRRGLELVRAGEMTEEEFLAAGG